MPADIDTLLSPEREVIDAAHDYLRDALGLPAEAPRRFDYYANLIEQRKPPLQSQGREVPTGHSAGVKPVLDERLIEHARARVAIAERELEEAREALRTHLSTALTSPTVPALPEPVDFSDVPQIAHVWGYTVDQMHERDAMWLARLQGIAKDSIIIREVRRWLAGHNAGVHTH